MVAFPVPAADIPNSLPVESIFSLPSRSVFDPDLVLELSALREFEEDAPGAWPEKEAEVEEALSVPAARLRFAGPSAS